MGKNSELEELFQKMLRGYSIMQYASNEICSAILWQLPGIISREINLNKDGKSGISRKRIEDIFEIYNRLDTVTVDELSRSCNLSTGRFSHVFKETMGGPPHKYINNMRIKKAKEMLLNTDMLVSEIAADVGFSDRNCFSRHFKNAVGISPKKIQRELNLILPFKT